jgi:alpha-ketoglutarate-dependent sulfate ester dioxygenase
MPAALSESPRTVPPAPSSASGTGESYDRFELHPLTPVIGAEIEGLDLRLPLDPETLAQLKRAIGRWRVLFFRDQEITDEQQLAFGRAFGPLTPAHPISEGLESHPEIWERAAAEYSQREKDKATASIAQPPRDYKGWHIDITFVANPNKYSILRGISIPPYGGDTLFSNLALAYANLSAPLRALLDGLQAVHRTSGYDGAQRKARRDGLRPGPFASLHPLVRIHPETGEKILFYNPGTTTHIVGLRERESEAILSLLNEEVTRPEYQVRFRWTPHAIALWDNQAVAHAGPIDYKQFDLPRVVRRITVAGELPRGPDGFVSRPLEGDLFPVLG